MPGTSIICDVLGPYHLHDIHVYNYTNKSSFYLHTSFTLVPSVSLAVITAMLQVACSRLECVAVRLCQCICCIACLWCRRNIFVKLAHVGCFSSHNYVKVTHNFQNTVPKVLCFSKKQWKSPMCQCMQHTEISVMLRLFNLKFSADVEFVVWNMNLSKCKFWILTSVAYISNYKLI
jgi:hypothetical protein